MTVREETSVDAVLSASCTISVGHLQAHLGPQGNKRNGRDRDRAVTGCYQYICVCIQILCIIYINICVYIYIQIYVYIYIYKYKYIYVFIYIYICIYICTCMCIYIHTYIHTYILYHYHQLQKLLRAITLSSSTKFYPSLKASKASAALTICTSSSEHLGLSNR